MQRSFLLNLALLLVLNLLVKPFYILGIDAGVQDAVGSATYGTYAALAELELSAEHRAGPGHDQPECPHIAQHTHLLGKPADGLRGARLVLVGLYALLTLVVAWCSVTKVLRWACSVG
jgi:hypothetical protein